MVYTMLSYKKNRIECEIKRVMNKIHYAENLDLNYCKIDGKLLYETITLLRNLGYIVTIKKENDKFFQIIEW